MKPLQTKIAQSIAKIPGHAKQRAEEYVKSLGDGSAEYPYRTGVMEALVDMAAELADHRVRELLRAAGDAAELLTVLAETTSGNAEVNLIHIASRCRAAVEFAEGEPLLYFETPAQAAPAVEATP